MALFRELIGGIDLEKYLYDGEGGVNSAVANLMHGVAVRDVARLCDAKHESIHQIRSFFLLLINSVCPI